MTNLPFITSQQEWTYYLPIQQQSVIMLGCRGCDGVEKHHNSKPLVRALRGVVMNAARFGRPLKITDDPTEIDDVGDDSFMSIQPICMSLHDIKEYKDSDSVLRHSVETKYLFGAEFILGKPWLILIREFFSVIDTLDYHYVNHIRQACEIVGYKHPHEGIRKHFLFAYLRMVDNGHLFPEPMETMDRRLNDFSKLHWDQKAENQPAKPNLKLVPRMDEDEYSLEEIDEDITKGS